MPDYRGNSNYPRGVRNNNFGNLRPFKILYKNQIGIDNGGHAIFANSQDGLNALVSDILYKINVRKLDTPRKFVARYAPASDGNNENLYRNVIKNFTGLNSDDKIQLDATSFTKFMNAIVSMELGKDWYNRIKKDEITAAVLNSAGGSPNLAGVNLIFLSILIFAAIKMYKS